MANSSLLQGSIWYWRKTYANVPIHSARRFSGTTNVKELCLVMDTPETAQKMTEELNHAGVQIRQKEVHLGSEHIPEGSTILYVRLANKKISFNLFNLFRRERK